MNYVLRKHKHVTTESVLPITKDFVNDFCNYLDDMKCYSIDENNNKIKATLSFEEAEHILSNEYNKKLKKHLKVFNDDYGYHYSLDNLFINYIHDYMRDRMLEGEVEEFIIDEDTYEWEFCVEK